MPFKVKDNFPKKHGALGLFAMPKIVRRLKKEEDGVTAVEFALLAFPFFMLMMSIIESSLMFFAGQVLESSVDDVGRQIRTGQLAQNMTETDLRDAICAASAVLFTCEDLKIDMQVVADYDGLGDMPQPVDGEWEPGTFGFTAAGPKQIVMVTVMTEWPIYTNYLEFLRSKLNNRAALLTAVAVFKTEPYS